MKRLAFIVGLVSVLAVGSIMTGCKSVPAADTVRVIAKAGGGATGLAMNYIDIDAAAAAVLTNIVSNIGTCTPKEGETVQDAIIRTSEAHVDILVARGDLTAQQGAMVLAAMRIIVKGYDLVIIWKPEIALYTELTFAALDGFSDGFLATYRPDNQLKSFVLTTDPTEAKFFNQLISCPEYWMMLPDPFTNPEVGSPTKE